MKKRCSLQLPLYTPSLLEGIIAGMPPEKVALLKDSGLIHDIAAAINGMEQSALIEALEQASERKGKPHIAIIVGHARADTLLRFDRSPDEKGLIAVMKKRRIFPATIGDILDLAHRYPDITRMGPLVATEFATISGCRFAACISMNDGSANDSHGGFDAKWVASAPRGAYFAARSRP